MHPMETTTPDTNSACPACGEFPVNHFSTYISNTLGAWEHDQMQSIGSKDWSARFSKALHAKIIMLEPYLMRALHALSLGRTHADPVRASTERAAAIWREALQRGIRMEQLVLFGISVDSYRAYLGDRWIYFESLPIPSRMKTRSFEWADDKFLFKQFLKRHQIPASPGVISTNLNDARESLKQLQMPVVVKPRIGSNSRHTTPLVHTNVQFADAFKLSQQLGRHVLFEEYLYGHLCRATVIDGKLVGFLESRQPFIVGDGIRTIHQLIDDKNIHKEERVSDVVFTEENEAHIRRQGYALDSIPEKGIVIHVARLPGRLTGGQTREIPAEVHPKLRDYVQRTAQLLQTPVVGFDLIIGDPEADPDTQKWGILEANTVPFIEIHNNPLYGKSSNVAAAVWDLWKSEG
jgi:cyanophycin synthetase